MNKTVEKLDQSKRGEPTVFNQTQAIKTSKYINLMNNIDK